MLDNIKGVCYNNSVERRKAKGAKKVEKKISWKDYLYMTHRENLPWFQKITCSYYVAKSNVGGGCYRGRVKVRWLWYLLLWLPPQLVNVVYYMWAEGLKNWDWDLPRVNDGAVFYVCDKKYADSTYNRMDKIWESY